MLTAQGLLHGETNSISPGDAFISCEQRLDSNQTIQILIKATQNRVLRLTAKIARSTHNGIGVCFTKISNEDRKFLYQVIVSSLHSEFRKTYLRK
jgi:hypothetical protein